MKVNKKFSEVDYLKNGEAFRKLESTFKYLYPILREEDFGIDVAIYYNERAYLSGEEPLFYAELECKDPWKGEIFPPYFKDVQFLSKKKRLADLDHPSYWVLFNWDCSNAGVLPIKETLNYPDEKVFCGKNIGWDDMVRIPKDKMFFGLHKMEKYLIQEALKIIPSPRIDELRQKYGLKAIS